MAPAKCVVRRSAAVVRVGILTAIICSLSVTRAQTTKLDAFVGRDLWKDQPSSDERFALYELLGYSSNGDTTDLTHSMEGPTPWHIWKTHGGRTKYVALLAEPMIMIPGGSSACVQLLDATATRINSRSFSTGWRIQLYGASIEYSQDLLSDVIVLHMAPVINGRKVRREYFAVNNDQLQFIRLENDKGELIPSEYVFGKAVIGFSPEATTVDQWRALLESQNRPDVLAALMFLGGKQVDEPRTLFRDLISDGRIRELIERLKTSENEWIRQAARLAAETVASAETGQR